MKLIDHFTINHAICVTYFADQLISVFSVLLQPIGIKYKKNTKTWDNMFVVGYQTQAKVLFSGPARAEKGLTSHSGTQGQFLCQIWCTLYPLSFY